MGVREKNIEGFINVTGAERDIAVHFLDACADNLETAITMFLDDKHESSKSGSSTAETSEEVRAPIPQTTGVLVNDPHYMTTSRDRWSSRRRPRTVFDAFRDFKAETKQQEDMIMSNTTQGRRLKRLEDLFRPPLELMHRGTFETGRQAHTDYCSVLQAREGGKSDNKWLMVNVQNVREFSCQVLNRDVWSKPSIQSLIRKNFLFWQVYSDSAEGDRFMTFYNVSSWPHVSILDPRTGERLTEWKEITVKSIQEKIEEFLVDHGSLHQSQVEPPSKRSKRDHSLIDDSEDTQLAAAIAASLKETKAVSDDDEFLATNCSTDEFSEFDGSSGDETPVEHAKKSVEISASKQTYKNGVENNKLRHLEETKLDNDFSVKSENSSLKRESCNNGNKTSSKTNEKIFPKKNRTNNVVGKNSTDDKNTKSTSKNDLTDSRIADSNETGDICHLMVRFPDGTREQMKMSANILVQDLSDKLSEKGFPSDHYEIVTNFPRRYISASSPEETLKSVGLFPRATVFVQEKEC